MKRRVFDLITSFVGLGLAALLFIAGGLLTWAHNFVQDEVHTQLAQQQIVFPKTTDPGFLALKGADAKAMAKYAGQPLTTGKQAQTWANHYIAVHLRGITAAANNGVPTTYAVLSGKLQAMDPSDPNYAKLSDTVETVFKGETLRGLLLNAYAFGTMGDIAGIASIAAYAGGGVLVVLAGLGVWHSRRVDDEVEILHDRKREVVAA